MEDKLALVLNELGIEGIKAFYFYTILDYMTLWVVIGLVVYGVRIVWKYETSKKKNNWE